MFQMGNKKLYNISIMGDLGRAFPGGDTFEIPPIAKASLPKYFRQLGRETFFRRPEEVKGVRVVNGYIINQKTEMRWAGFGLHSFIKYVVKKGGKPIDPTLFYHFKEGFFEKYQKYLQ